MAMVPDGPNTGGKAKPVPTKSTVLEALMAQHGGAGGGQHSGESEADGAGGGRSGHRLAFGHDGEAAHDHRTALQRCLERIGGVQTHLRWAA
jgi:hypothetical protein